MTPTANNPYGDNAPSGTTVTYPAFYKFLQTWTAMGGSTGLKFVRFREMGLGSADVKDIPEVSLNYLLGPKSQQGFYGNQGTALTQPKSLAATVLLELECAFNAFDQYPGKQVNAAVFMEQFAIAQTSAAALQSFVLTYWSPACWENWAVELAQVQSVAGQGN